MPLPTIESIKTTIEKYHDTNIHDTNLKGYKPIPGLLGPMFYPGGFGVVFPMQNSAGHKYAFRVWHKEIPGIKDRTNKIAQYLKQLNLPYFVEFDYVPGGLTVEEEDGQQTVDTVRMDWVEGANLHDFITNSKETDTPEEFKRKMRDLAANFKKLFKDLHQVGVSHGDLQHGNVVIGEDLSIKLVDYDSVYVPTIQGEQQITSGLTGYQHPIRKTTCMQAAPYDDYFSELIIYSGLLALSIKPDLWPDDEEEIDNFSFLFTDSDFDNIQNCTHGMSIFLEKDFSKISCHLFQTLANVTSSDPQEQKSIVELKTLLVLLVNYLMTSDLSTLKPMNGTEKKRPRNPKYDTQDTTQTDIDAETLQETLKELGATTRKTYGNSNVTRTPVNVSKTDPVTRKDKYRNQL
ncbi:serine/threonine-protein kinase [Leyella stercorea]|uniref:serine/threonine-protein kinase n=1 Tax=Leyella stercorea TaxID=363265 RepID=UPI00242DFE4F|nr:serine/threonine-protein kinase [Leyella stercorea]